MHALFLQGTWVVKNIICRKISLEGTKILILVGVASWGLRGGRGFAEKLKLHTALKISKLRIHEFIIPMFEVTSQRKYQRAVKNIVT